MQRAMKILNIIGLIAGLSAVMVFTFYLLLDYQSPIVFIEPTMWIRVPEIIWGFIAIPVLIKYLVKEVKCKEL